MDRLLRDRCPKTPARQLPRFQCRDRRADRQSRYHTGAVVQHAHKRGVEEYRERGSRREEQEGQREEL